MYRCSHCGFRAQTKEDLAVHVKNNHAAMTISCSLCKFKTSSHLQYNSHVNKRHTDIPWSEHIKVYKCDMCTFTSLYIEQIDLHHSAEHGIEKQFACAKCNATFKSRRKLRRHWTRDCYNKTHTPLKGAIPVT